MMKTALCLGGAGFLGSHLIPKLLERGYEVTSVDPRITNGRIPNPHLTDYGDIRFMELVPQFDYVFHLAASLTQRNIEERNKLGVDAFSDIELDLQVARYLEAKPPRERAVWMSSAATDAKDTENYAFVKYVSERFARNLAMHDVPITILKPYGGYGPGQSLNYPMPAIIDRALRKEDPLCVWGNAHTMRDWIYVDDLVEAMLMAADGAFPKKIGAIPIGTGIATSFGDLAKQIASHVGYAPKIEADFSKPVGSARRVAEIYTAKNCGFEAKVRLSEGIARCIEAQRKP